MKEEHILQILIYCQYCRTTTQPKYFLGDCSHLLCENCLSNFDYCKICKDSTNFILVEKDTKKKILKNPSENFNDSFKFTLFQLNSAVNLVYHYKEQIEIYKKLLKKAKNELELSKKSKKIVEESNENSFVNNRINQIYKRGRLNSMLSDKNRGKSNNKLNSSVTSASRITLERNKGLFRKKY
ncbi:zinc ring-type protein [Tubulinosema ratisbonensis]|uniref:Zinc ring-type protein n=1 Tax=Tubulinosema ratisbonensis TaxID=291195 RepID=A0A437AJ23_9MICR|nr:zinc ring-type protein [Tubulinosema ratisbonensis]